MDTLCDTFLVIMAQAAAGFQVVELWSGADLYISILIPKGTIRKCDKNNLLKTGASRNTYEFNILFLNIFPLDY